jgi:4'-phosphopantetheinyl transferase
MKRFLRPAEDEVHIRSIAVAGDAPQAELYERLLSPAERVRSGRLLSLQARKLFLAGRCFLRQVLGGYLGIGPECLDLALSEQGKPYLVDESGPGAGLAFNLSHSGELILLAVTSGRQVGIDLERMAGDPPFREMARIAFSPREQEQLFSLPVYLQPAAFYRCWTRKEALMKARGSGFTLPSNCFDVSLLPEDPPALLGWHNLSEKQPIWQLFDLAVPPGYCAALAVEGPDPVQLFFRPTCQMTH